MANANGTARDTSAETSQENPLNTDATDALSALKDAATELDLSNDRLKAVLDLMGQQLNNPATNDMTPFVLLDAAQRYATEIEQIMGQMYAAAGMRRAGGQHG